MTLTSGPSASDERSSGRPLEALENEARGHAARFSKFIRGRNPLTGRNTHGTEIRCSCGWKWRTNENMREAERIHRHHTEAAAPSGVAGSSAECSEQGLKDSASASRPDGQTGTGGQHEQG